MEELFIEKSDRFSNHTITSEFSLSCSDTGRVMAVFYNEHDIDVIISEMKNDKAKISALKKMIDNGIGWEDLEKDFKSFQTAINQREIKQ